MSFRCFVHVPDQEGSGLHRAILPVKNCYQELQREGIYLTGSSSLDSLDYDVFVFHRCCTPFKPVIERIKDMGKRFVWELDDDYWTVPASNPAHQYQDIDMLNWLRDQADKIIVSTEPLAYAVDRLPKTTVLPNLVDVSLWPQVERTPNDRVRILWAGSVHHAEDIEEVVPAVERIIAEYGERVLVLFWGDLPDSMSDFVRVRYSHIVQRVPADRYRGCLGLIQSVPTEQYPETAVTIQPDIGIAPLVDCSFNRSKSAIKWHDYSMAGAAFIGTNLPPYQCIEPHEGILVRAGDSDGWYKAIKRLIDDETRRQLMAAQALTRVSFEWTWIGPKRQKWLDFFRSLA